MIVSFAYCIFPSQIDARVRSCRCLLLVAGHTLQMLIVPAIADSAPDTDSGCTFTIARSMHCTTSVPGCIVGQRNLAKRHFWTFQKPRFAMVSRLASTTARPAPAPSCDMPWIARSGLG
jgi:hypothetical protein